MINIVSGEELKKDALKLNIKENIISFNEAMCEGTPDEDIFSYLFVLERVDTLNTSLIEYDRLVISNIDKININEEITLWFGLDMFCCINVLTILAYLEQRGYTKNVCINFVDEKKCELIHTISVDVSNASAEYISILCKKQKIVSKYDFVNEIIDLYLNYNTKNHKEIKRILQNCNEDNKRKKIGYLLNNNDKYGLGDIQWEKWIDSIK